MVPSGIQGGCSIDEGRQNRMLATDTSALFNSNEYLLTCFMSWYKHLQLVIPQTLFQTFNWKSRKKITLWDEGTGCAIMQTDFQVSGLQTSLLQRDLGKHVSRTFCSRLNNQDREVVKQKWNFFLTWVIRSDQKRNPSLSQTNRQKSESLQYDLALNLNCNCSEETTLPGQTGSTGNFTWIPQTTEQSNHHHCLSGMTGPTIVSSPGGMRNFSW